MSERAAGSGRTTLAVLGAGTMGHGIAQVAAMAGYDTRLFDVLPQALHRKSLLLVVFSDRHVAGRLRGSNRLLPHANSLRVGQSSFRAQLLCLCVFHCPIQ